MTGTSEQRLSLVPVAAEVLAELVRRFAPERVAVERNREIVPRSTLEEVAVNEGDAFEIVHFVGGG